MAARLAGSLNRSHTVRQQATAKRRSWRGVACAVTLPISEVTFCSSFRLRTRQSAVRFTSPYIVTAARLEVWAGAWIMALRTQTTRRAYGRHLPPLPPLAVVRLRGRAAAVLHVLRAETHRQRARRDADRHVHPAAVRRTVGRVGRPPARRDAGTRRRRVPVRVRRRAARPGAGPARDRRLPAPQAPRRRRHGHRVRGRSAPHRHPRRGQTAVVAARGQPVVGRTVPPGGAPREPTRAPAVRVRAVRRHRRRAAVHRHGADARPHPQRPHRRARPDGPGRGHRPASST